MRIDFQFTPRQSAESDRTRAQATSSGTHTPVNAVSVPEDLAQLSSANTQVQALASQASQLPEIREQRVAALRQALQNGQYRFDSETTAGSLLAHMLLAPAT